jgi:predicted permease
MLEALSAIPGVRSAALADSPPISNGAWRSSMHPTGYTPGQDEEMAAVLKRVSGRYFETTGSELVSGRALAPSDSATATKVVVVNQTLANKYFPHGDAVGRTIGVDIGTGDSWNIVGIARDTRAFDLRGKAPEPMIYLPVAQLTDAKGQGTRDSFASTLLIRTAGDPATTTRAVRDALHSVDPNLPILNIRTMQEHLDTFTSSETLISRLTSTFAMLAVLLSAIGLYGVMSFNVIRRTNEIGIRMALGASNSGVQWMVLRESLWLLAIGLAIGLPATFAATRLLRSQLYQMSPFDPIVFVAATLGIAAITLLSAWLPSRRAASIDPMVALRYD